ncbi:MAG: energy transducer TonB [Terriglobales bacterium]
MPVLERKVEAEVTNPTPEDLQPKQRRRMLIALALVLASLIIVAAKNWTFWSQYLFPPDTASQADASDDSSAEITTEAVPKVPQTLPPSSHRTKAKSRKQTATATAKADAASGPVVTTSRAVLPPLQVEVVAGDHHQTVHSGSNSVKVDMQEGTPAISAPAAVANGNARQATIVAADRVKISPSAAEVISHPVRPNYPLLARQMKVEGAVVLQALIGKEGTIQDLRVISGPEILSAAARQAVLQWHFKPYLQDGQAVETQARITVNFTISTN